MIIALDLETTWLDKREEKIIEIALVKIDEKSFKIVGEFSSLVNPEKEIPDLISNITNISNDDVKDSPKFEEIKDKIKEFIWDYPILWHNVAFDKGFLLENKIDIKENIALDTFFLANFLLSKEKSLNLEHICNSLWIKLKWAHRALNDTIATAKLFEALIKKVKKLPKNKIKLLNFILSKTQAQSWKFIKDKYLDKKIEKHTQDTFIKSMLKVVKKYKKIEIEEKQTINKEKDFKKIITKIDWLEFRENQIEMSKIVNKALNKWEKVAIEAPTWIWKTFAYLLPSIIFAKEFWEQVYISTSTKVLQDQIFYKDLDFIKKNIDIDFSYSKLKWKNNYLWVWPFLDFLFLEESIEENKVSFVLKILFWLFDTQSWELDELNYYWEEFSFLKQVNANNPYIFSKENPFEIYEYVLKARRNSRNSDIVIINNNILFQDIALEWSILWNLKNLVLDEAHNLEDILTNSIKKSFSIIDIEKIFSKINKIIKKHKIQIYDLDNKVDKLIFDLNGLFNLLEWYIAKKTQSDSKYKKVLISDDFFVDISIEGLLEVIKQWFREIYLIFDDLDEDIYLYFSKEINFLEEIQNTIEVSMSNSTDNYIKMTSLYDNKVYLEYTLLNPWSFLKENLWNKLDSVVLTSATLKIWDSFDYIKKIISIEDFEITELETEFDYKKQALLFIPNDIWSIKNNLDSVIDFLWRFFKLVKWKTLVLFTAFYNIKECYTKLNFSLKKDNISLLAQSIWWSKHKQINIFKNNPENSILIWTDTFWEWIDIPWDDLKYLIIHKIPFMVPTDPIFIARSKLFKDSFKDYSIPKSIIKLKQGFWRLIRTKTDKWIVVFLDDRINKTMWWKRFYEAFPADINIKTSNTDIFLEILKKY